MCIFKLRQWESEFFGKKIYDVDFESVRSLKDFKIPTGLVVKKIETHKYKQIDTLTSHGFILCEGELGFSKKITDIGNAYENRLIDYASCGDYQNIISWTSDIYRFSRFRMPWFTSKEKNSFYNEWLRRSILGEFDDCCIVARDEFGYVVGFVTVKVNDGEARIGLIGVSESSRGHGISKRLLLDAEAYSSARSAINISVATQTSNIVAARLYANTGYNINSSSYWFYR